MTPSERWEGASIVKSILAAVVAVLFFSPSPLLAGTCRVIEYAELKETTSGNLVKTYCHYSKLVNLERNYLAEAREMYQGSNITPLSKELLEEHFKDLTECLDTQMKIQSALKNRSEPVEPTCG